MYRVLLENYFDQLSRIKVSLNVLSVKTFLKHASCKWQTGILGTN